MHVCKGGVPCVCCRSASSYISSLTPEVDLRTIRRVVLFNYNAETGLIDFRHYDITVRASGTSKSVRSVLSSNLPDLSAFDDIAEFVLRSVLLFLLPCCLPSVTKHDFYFIEQLFIHQ